jgi:hypothetical protein
MSEPAPPYRFSLLRRYTHVFVEQGGIVRLASAQGTKIVEA